jgi:hypothetical protein
LAVVGGDCFDIGFDWLCFSAVSGGIYSHNPLSQKTLRQFERLQIGFVFSNRQAGETPDLLLSITIVYCLLAIRYPLYAISIGRHLALSGFVSPESGAASIFIILSL